MKHKPSSTNAARLAAVRIQPLTTPAPKARARHLLAQHHYLGDVHAFGEPLGYAITDDHHQWLGVLVFCAAIRRLRAPDPWIGCSEEQPRRRLPLLANNCRFLLLPAKTFPNLASRSLRLCLDRLSNDGQARYQHPVLIVETFVDPEPFCGTADSASGWQELGTTDGFGRVRRDFYVAHPKPKRLFVRELCKNARRHLQADRLQPSLAAVEARTPPRCTQRVTEIRALLEQLVAAPPARVSPCGDDADVGRSTGTELRRVGRTHLAQRCRQSRSGGLSCCGASGVAAAAPAPASARDSGVGDEPAADGTRRHRLADGQSGRVGMENGRHQRLDPSQREDESRVRTPRSLRVLGMLRRFSDSIGMHWRSRQRRPHQKSMTDFLAAMDAEDHRSALCALRSHHPTFQTPS